MLELNRYLISHFGRHNLFTGSRCQLGVNTTWCVARSTRINFHALPKLNSQS